MTKGQLLRQVHPVIPVVSELIEQMESLGFDGGIGQLPPIRFTYPTDGGEFIPSLSRHQKCGPDAEALRDLIGEEAVLETHGKPTDSAPTTSREQIDKPESMGCAVKCLVRRLVAAFLMPTAAG